MTDGAQIAAAAAAVGERLDGLVDNAGIAIAAPLELVPLDELRHQLEVNVVGQVAVTQAFLPALRRARGRIVLMGSIGGKSALPFLGPYAASKHALEAVADLASGRAAPVGHRGRHRRAGEHRDGDLGEGRCAAPTSCGRGSQRTSPSSTRLRSRASAGWRSHAARGPMRTRSRRPWSTRSRHPGRRRGISSGGTPTYAAWIERLPTRLRDRVLGESV